MRYEENKYKRECCFKLRNLYVEKKYKEIIKDASKYLEEYPNDVNIRFMYAKSLKREDRFIECIENLKINLQLEPNDRHSIVLLYYTYYFLGMYKEAWELLPKVCETNLIRRQSLLITKTVIKKALGMPLYLYSCEKDNYVKNQIVNYDSNLALEHIQEHTDVNKTDNAVFNDIDIKYLIDVVKENIVGVKKANIEEALDVYFFGVSNIGKDKENIMNYIKVVVAPNTHNIVSIYPTINIEEKYTYPLNYDHDKLFKKGNKIKTMSRIDKFNKKYNM